MNMMNVSKYTVRYSRVPRRPCASCYPLHILHVTLVTEYTACVVDSLGTLSFAVYNDFSVLGAENAHASLQLSSQFFAPLY